MPDKRVHMYVAGFPCQPYSCEGLGLGWEDERGAPLFRHMIRRLATLAQTLQSVLLENAPHLLEGKKHKNTFEHMLAELRAVLPTFSWHWRVLDSLDYGVAQRRRRLYIVGLRRSHLVDEFRWPEPSGQKVSLDDVLEQPTAICERAKCQMLSKLSNTNRRNLEVALKDLHSRGMDPSKTTFAIDIDTGRWRNKLWSFPRVQCLTKARAGQGGPFLSSRLRRTTLAELARLQGLDLSGYDTSGLTSSQLGGMLLCCVGYMVMWG